MTSESNISEEFFRFKTYVHETATFLRSIYDFLLENDADVENGDRLKASELWNEIKNSLRNTMSYCVTLKSALSDSKEPLQLEMLVKEFRRNAELVKLQREAFILETTPRFLGIPGARIASLESMNSTFWDAKEMYDELIQRNLHVTEEDAKVLRDAWVRVEEDWERLRKTHETVRKGILERRYSITHLKLLITYLSQSKFKLNIVKEVFGRNVSNLLLKDLETLATLENETGPIHLERAFYYHSSKLYLSLKERCLVLIERVRTGEAISIQKFAFTIETMFMTLMDVFLNSNQEHLRARVIGYEPGKFLGNLYVTVNQLLDLLRTEYDIVIASVMDCLNSLTKLAVAFEAKGYANMNDERHHQMICAEEYSRRVIEEISSRTGSLNNSSDVEGVTLKTVWLAKVFKYETVKKLEAFLRALDDVWLLPTDNFLSMATIARAIPDLPTNGGSGDRWSLSEDFILGVLEQFLPPETEEVREFLKDTPEKVVRDSPKDGSDKVVAEFLKYTTEKAVGDIHKNALETDTKKIPKHTASQPTKIVEIKENVNGSGKSPSHPGEHIRRETLSSTGRRKLSKLPIPTSRKSSFFKRNVALN